MSYIYVPCCADLHRVRRGHPADDSSREWDTVWAEVDADVKLALGDMTDYWIDPTIPADQRIPTSVAGNHDPHTGAPEEIVIGDTLFCHGHQFDPPLYRRVGLSVARLVGRLERVWPRADVKLAHAAKVLLRGGRYGRWRRYARAAAKRAIERRVRQIVIGHLHESHSAWFGRVLVRSIGPSCNGELTIETVRVRTS